MEHKKIAFFNYLIPQNWIISIALLSARLLSYLPFHWILKLGHILGVFLYFLPSKRSTIAIKNIDLCFPTLSDFKKKKLLKKHFSSLGIGLLEVAMVRWKSNKAFKKLITVNGLDHLRNAVKKDKGVILMSAHFTSLEVSALIGRKEIVSDLPPLVGMYRLGSNEIINQFFRQARLRSVEGLVTKFEVKSLIKALKEKKIIWYASDQNFTGKNAIELDFFNQKAMTNTAITRFIEITGCSVLPFFPTRLENHQGYSLTIYPEINYAANQDSESFLKEFYRVLEEHIKKNPEQYYWIHRRFKSNLENKNPYL
jgi:Kdo2-lipid IVA lauroyltransferase/acyltransferase